MVGASELVPESAYDYAEIIARGGENGLDEDYVLIKCLHCGELYLHDLEIDTVFTDPEDLARRQAVDLWYADALSCLACGEAIPGHRGDTHRTGLLTGLPSGHRTGLLTGRREVCPIYQVTWEEVARSRWAWTIRPSAWPARHR